MSYSPRRTPEQWQQLIEQQVSSKLTQKAFCQKHSIRPATFGYWKRKLSAISSIDEQTSSSWLDLSDVLNAPKEHNFGSWKIELDLGNGMVLRLSPK